MSRFHVNRFAAPGTGNRAGAKIGFYSDSGATSPVTLYATQYGAATISAVFADDRGQMSTDLWVDSTVTTLYARTETPFTTPTSTVIVGTANFDPPASGATSISLIDCGNAA